MKNLKDILQEAFITKSNISKMSNDSIDFEKLESLKEQIFSDPSKIWAEKELTKILERQDLMPEGNIFRNRSIKEIKWKVKSRHIIYGNGFSINAETIINVKNNPIAYSIPICTILKTKILAPDENIGAFVNSQECDGNGKDILDDIYDVCEKISEYLDIPIKDRRNAIKLD